MAVVGVIRRLSVANSPMKFPLFKQQAHHKHSNQGEQTVIERMGMVKKRKNMWKIATKRDKERSREQRAQQEKFRVMERQTQMVC